MFGAEVTLVHVCDLGSHNGFELYARPAIDIAREHWSLALRNLSFFLNLSFPLQNPGADSERVLRYAKDAALAAESDLQDLSYSLVRDSPCPVVSV